MGLNAALHIGKSGLLTSQAAIEVTGNNLANVSTRGYHRQQVTLSPLYSQEIQSGIFVGRGVQLQSVTRQIDEALEARLRGSIADQNRSLVQNDILTQIEAIQNEFSDSDLTTQLNAFFNVWSQLANNPQDNSLRSLVIQEGKTLSSFVRTLRSDLTKVRGSVDDSIDAAVVAANNILSQVEQINQAIVNAEAGRGGAHDLRDQRDLLLQELSKYVDISTVESYSGSVDVFVGSTPVVLNGKSLGLDARKTSIGDDLKIEVVLKSDGTVLDTSSGQIGALVRAREEDAAAAVAFLDEFTSTLIFEVNRIHSQGQGLSGFSTITGTNRVADSNVPLNHAGTELAFQPTHGSFRISVQQISTGQRVTETINIDLDGINAASDTSLDDIATAISAVNGVTATITPDGRLKIDSAGSDFEFSFSDDTSGVLAVLGINTYFTGSDAQDIRLNDLVNNSTAALAAGQGFVVGDNRNALALAGLGKTSLPSVEGLSLTESWNRHIEDYAVRLSQARQGLAADNVVRANLESQQQQRSGVNLDEETINLLNFQRAYQGSARFITVVDELMQTLLSIL